MTNKQKLTLIFFIIIFWLNFYISSIFSWINLVFLIAFYSILFYILYGIYKKIFTKDFVFFSGKNYNIFLKEFLYRISSLFIALIVIIWWFSYYQNEINPAKMPEFSITNWEKTIVFQSMSHIWTPKFYQKVKENIKTLKENNYVLYFEWVRPWSEKSHEIFNKALWIKFDKNTYSQMSKLYWLVQQENELFLGLVNDLDYNVDISIDEIIKYYEDLKIQNNIYRTYKTPIDVNQMIIQELSKLNDKELKILRYINKSFVNMIIKNKNLQKIIYDNFTNKELFEIILNKRNEIIAKKIINSPDKNIVMIYGMLHFDWIFDILKQHDIRWKIIKINYLYPLK